MTSRGACAPKKHESQHYFIYHIPNLDQTLKDQQEQHHLQHHHPQQQQQKHNKNNKKQTNKKQVGPTLESKSIIKCILGPKRFWV